MRVLLSFLIVGILFFSSCGVSKDSIAEPVISDIITGKVEKVIYNSNSTDSTSCSIDYSYFASSKFAYRDSINQRIEEFVIRSTEFGGRAIGRNMLSNMFFQAQLDSFAKINKEEIDEIGDDGLNHLWELESLIQIDDSKNEFVQLQLTEWSYTGGAHGNGSTTTLIYDKVSAKKMLLEDLFSDLMAVTVIGESYFRALYDLTPDTNLDDAGFWFEGNKFHLNNNFSIVGDTIVFLYNSYEIAPYSGGQTIIEIPIEEIKNYLKIKI